MAGSYGNTADLMPVPPKLRRLDNQRQMNPNGNQEAKNTVPIMYPFVRAWLQKVNRMTEPSLFTISPTVSDEDIIQRRLHHLEAVNRALGGGGV